MHLSFPEASPIVIPLEPFGGIYRKFVVLVFLYAVKRAAALLDVLLVLSTFRFIHLVLLVLSNFDLKSHGPHSGLESLRLSRKSHIQSVISSIVPAGRSASPSNSTVI